MEDDYLSCSQLIPEWHPLPQMAQAAFCLWAYQRWICWHPPVPLSASIITPWKLPLLLGGFGVEYLQPSLGIQVSYVFPPPALVPLVLSKFLAEHVKGQLRHLILVSPCWMEAPWLPTVLNMLADLQQHSPIIKDLVMDVSIGHVFKGLPYLHLTL